MIDEVRIYKRALASSEIAAMYAGATDGLILHYTFDNDKGGIVSDDSGHGNDGLLQNATAYVPGLTGLALEVTGDPAVFSANGGHVLLPFIDFQTMDEFSLSLWVNEQTQYNASGEAYIVFGKGGAGGKRVEIFRGDIVGGSSLTVFRVGTNGFYMAFDSSYQNRFVFYCLTYTNGIMSAYCDGELIGQQAATVEQESSNAALGRGWWYWNGERTSTRLFAQFDDVRVYSRGLSSNEVAMLYDAASPVEVQLTIAGDPAEYGSPAPLGYGTNSVHTGTVVSNSVDAMVAAGVDTRHVCAGWTGSGDVPASGLSNGVTFMLNTDSVLTWLWRTEYLLDTTDSLGGTVVATDGWYTNGAVVTIGALPDTGYAFSGWIGDVPATSMLVNPLEVTMDQPRSVSASFAHIVPWPSGDVVLTERRPEFLWPETDGATWYYLWINRNDSTYFRQWLGQSNGLWQADFDMQGGEYDWWVQPWSPSDGYGEWSSRISYSISNMVPGKAMGLMPAGSISTNAPLFTWNPVPYATWYRIWLNRNGALHDSWWVERDTSAMPRTPLPYGLYQWWIRAWSPDGEGDWSDAVSFDYGVAIPVAPQGSLLGSRRPQFSWTGVDRATWYEVLVKRNGISDRQQWVQTGTNYTFPTDILYGAYEWWVRAWNPDGMGPWSGAAAFDSGSPITSSASGTRLCWDDQNSADATWYRVRIRSASGRDVLDSWIARADTTVIGTDRCFEIRPPLSSGVYQVSMCAWRPGDGVGPWTPGLAFKAVPTNGVLSSLSFSGSSGAVELGWGGMEDRVYNIWCSTNLEAGFFLLQTNVLCNGVDNVFTNEPDLPATCFFRLELAE